jgi:photosystem II stability/assembly factor-like uncharacterized protein
MRLKACLLVLLVALPISMASGQTSAVYATDVPVTLAETMQQDASIADVTFVDRATGWAVGDRGVIWHTGDGGLQWKLQPSGVTCSLATVSFIDTQRGWAAGGTTPPLAQGSRGVLLATTDGGATWTEVEQATLPAVTRIKFFDASHGIAAGGASPLFPSGVFVTKDGGKTWQPLAADAPGEWLAADFPDAETGAVAGRGGEFATLMRRRVTRSPSAVSNSRAYRALRLAPPTGGWLVGDGGLVMTTRDLGNSWETPGGDLPAGAAASFDFRAVAVLGTNIWIAGSPGTRVFHSGDGGFTWQAQATGQRTPLRAIMFIDANTGFAAGDLGAILGTTDGGRTWHEQRQGGKRAAMVAVFARDTDVPLELMGKLGAEEAYLAAVELLHPAVSTTESRTQEAMLLAGATSSHSAWQFPIQYTDDTLSADDLLAQLNRDNDGRAAQLMGRYLVRQLRMWRPEVVVTHPGEPIFCGPLASLVQQLVSHSVEAAADASQFPELMTDAGLEPWDVKKVYGVLPAGSTGEVRIAAGQFAPRLGTTLADWAEPPRRLLQAEAAPAPEMIELQTLVDSTDATTVSRDPFAGVRLIPGSEARRRLANLPSDDVEALRRLATRRRQMRKIVEQSQGNAAWAGQVANLTEGLDAASAGELLFELAETYRAAGRLDLAADTYTTLARRAPEHPLVEAALTWLVQFYASGEAAQRLANSDATNIREPEPITANAVQQASALAAVEENSAPVVGLSRDHRLDRAAALGKYLESARPALYANPQIRFPLVVAQRQLGFANPAQRYFLSLRSLPENDAWRRCSQTEEWFTKSEGLPPPKTLGSCRKVEGRPHLDGALDDPIWQQADRLTLAGAAEGKSDASAADVRVVYDDQFLYVAVQCPKTAGYDYSPDEHPRPRDADLSARDHVEIQLDVDRDYTTAFELAVDHRGWTRDTCWNDATWNPTWFVAAADDEASWSIEAAIPLAQLTSEPPAARQVWAASIVRTIPRGGEETWSGATDQSGAAGQSESPDRFGLLIFE